MIKKISIYNYKSFHPTTPTVIDIDTAKQATFMYGLNGAGKSAIGEVVHGCSINDSAFAHCKVTPIDHGGPFRYLVYNHDFVTRVVGETMPGIFTIGEADTIKQQEIDQLETENLALEVDLTTLRGRQDATQKQVDAQVTLGIDNVWKAHGWGKKTKLASLLAGYGKDKKKFFDELRAYAIENDTPLDDMDRLEQRWSDVSSTAAEKESPPIDLSGLAEIETDPVWAEAIEVSNASRLSTLIAKLGNGDWVDQGRPYVGDNTCPFCQQSLPHDFGDELAKLLEGDRKLKLEKIDVLASSYALRLERIQERMVGVFDDAITKDTGLELAWSKLEARIKANLTLMRSKQRKPSDPVVIETSDQEAMTKALATLQEKIDDYNQRILDRDSERARIRAMFYQLLCADRAEAYANHDAALDPLKAQLAVEQESVRAVADRISENRLRLVALRTAQTGVDASVEAINARLKDLGIDSFWIKPQEGDGHLYCLGRPTTANCSAKTLSEGEKTLISFLYFVELIKGNHEVHGTADIGRTVVVIDDPISSLSQNYIYDIATLIQHELIKPAVGLPKVKQVIVLTHNLFFFHELIHQQGGKLINAHRKCQMLLVQKSDYTTVVPLEPMDYMNDYDALWQVLRDAKDNPALVRAVPNAMRCILEQFFSFTSGIQDFDNALDKMAEQDNSYKFTALQRYLNRGSHKDGINGTPMDWSQYDVAYFLKKLRALLKEVNHEEHYLQRMADEIASPELAE